MKLHARCLELREILRGQRHVGKAAQDLAEQHIYVGPGLRSADSRPQPSDQMKRLCHAVGVAVVAGWNLLLHRKWYPHVRRFAQLVSEKFGRRYTHHRENSRSQRELPTDDTSIAAESPLPPGTVHNGNRMCVLDPVILLAEHATDQSLHAECWKVTSGNQLDVHGLGGQMAF